MAYLPVIVNAFTEARMPSIDRLDEYFHARVTHGGYQNHRRRASLIALLGALEQEIRGVVASMANTRRVRWAGRLFHFGEILTTPVVVGHSGVGKSLAAMAAQLVIDKARPEVLIFAGIAGALNPAYQIGDVVVAGDMVQHDMDATEFGFSRGEIPHEKIREVESDPALVDAALRWKPAGRSVFRGRILSGDQFISADSAARTGLRSELGGDAVEMEGASAGLVAHLNGVPFLLVRIISDSADGKAAPRFGEFLGHSSLALFELMRHLISTAT